MYLQCILQSPAELVQLRTELYLMLGKIFLILWLHFALFRCKPQANLPMNAPAKHAFKSCPTLSGK